MLAPLLHMSFDKRSHRLYVSKLHMSSTCLSSQAIIHSLIRDMSWSEVLIALLPIFIT